MLQGITVAPLSLTQSILCQMDKLPYVFNLTGSRVFGNAKPESDHDFFVEESLDLPMHLQQLGFDTLYNGGYKDSEINSVWRNPKARIDIQVVKDAHLKLKIQNFLLQRHDWQYVMVRLPKCSRGAIWDLAFCLEKGIQVDTSPHRKQPQPANMSAKCYSPWE